MNSLEFWMGTTIGVIVALIIILAIVSTAGSKNAKSARSFNERSLVELMNRNDIGRAQCSSLQVIGNALMNQQETAVEMRDLLAKQYGTQDEDEAADDYNDEPGIQPDKLATMTRHKESWQAEAIRLENEKTALVDALKRFESAATVEQLEASLEDRLARQYEKNDASRQLQLRAVLRMVERRAE